MSQITNTSGQAAAGSYIDAHVHVWTDDFDRYPLAAGFSKDQMHPPTFTPDELLALSKPLGVSRIVLIQMNFYGFDNSYMLDCMRKYPGVFSGIAQVDEHGANPAAEMRRLKGLGVHGVRIRSATARSRWLARRPRACGPCGPPPPRSGWQCAP